MNITHASPPGPRQPHSVQRVIIVHGYAATPDAHWFPWLRDSLHSEGVDAVIVALPSPEKPNAAAWEEAVRTAVGTPDTGTWIVAHSLGAITALRMLGACPEPWELGGLVLVSGFDEVLESLPILDDYLAAAGIDAEGIAGNVGALKMIRSDADPFVPPAASDRLAGRLGAQVYVQPDASHFLAEDGITSLPLVLELLHRPNRIPVHHHAGAGEEH